MGNTVHNLLGETFGRLTVIRQAARAADGEPMWRCRCTCGTITVVRRRVLTSGDTKSCGCLRREYEHVKNEVTSKREIVMKSYVPINQKTVMAVRLTEELLADRGDWVVVNPENNTVFSMSNDEFTTIYGTHSVPEKPVVARVRAPKKTPARYHSLEGSLTMQCGRFFYILMKLDAPATSKQIAACVTAPDKASSVSPTMGHIESLGGVTKAYEGGFLCWTPTDRGRTVFEKLNMKCFEGFKVPDVEPLL